MQIPTAACRVLAPCANCSHTLPGPESTGWGATVLLHISSLERPGWILFFTFSCLSGHSGCTCGWGSISSELRQSRWTGSGQRQRTVQLARGRQGDPTVGGMGMGIF